MRASVIEETIGKRRYVCPLMQRKGRMEGL